jgi:hypothetical protein
MLAGQNSGIPAQLACSEARNLSIHCIGTVFRDYPAVQSFKIGLVGRELPGTPSQLCFGISAGIAADSIALS